MAIYSGFYPLKMVIFHSYVKLPEGTHSWWRSRGYDEISINFMDFTPLAKQLEATTSRLSPSAPPNQLNKAEPKLRECQP